MYWAFLAAARSTRAGRRISDRRAVVAARRLAFRWEATAETPTIPMEVVEIDDCYVVKAMIPGLSNEDIHVEIDGRQAMIATRVQEVAVREEGSALAVNRVDLWVRQPRLLAGLRDRPCEGDREIRRRRADAHAAEVVPAHGEPLKIM